VLVVVRYELSLMRILMFLLALIQNRILVLILPLEVQKRNNILLLVMS
jgi:hypothetical protein